MKNLVIVSLLFVIGAAAIAEDKLKGTGCCSHESQLQVTVDQLSKKVEALEAAANKSASNGADDLEQRVSKLEKAINGTGGDGSGLEGRVSKLELTVRQI